jgi:hypothetical protein
MDLNAGINTTMKQAFANNIKDKLFNTVELSNEGLGYRGYMKK